MAIAKSRVRFAIVDPATGLVKLNDKEFENHWLSSKNESGERVGVALSIEPTPAFYDSVYYNADN